MSIVYLDGAYIPKGDAMVSVDDRGFLFGDGVYEVTPCYEGVPFQLDRHLDRLRGGLAWMRIDFDVSALEPVTRRLLADNDLTGAETSLVYVQITRGVAPRAHPFPSEPVTPTVYAFAKAWTRPPPERWEQGFRAITVPDRRWSRVDVKTIALLPNVLAYQEGVEAGVDDVIQVRDGIALEGAHNNFFAVLDGTVVTHPRTNLVLPGVTRGLVIELARKNGIPIDERPIGVEELPAADELFFTGTTSEIKPTVEVDGRPVGDGTVGPITKALHKGFRREVDRVRRAGW